jgi:hypothetical protein
LPIPWQQRKQPPRWGRSCSRSPRTENSSLSG